MKKGFRNVRGAIKSERAYHARWERKQQEKLKAKYGIEKEKAPEARIDGKGNQ